MAEYINFEAEASDNDEIPMDDDPIFDDPMLIDDAEDQTNNEPSFFRFVNQTTNTDEVLARIRELLLLLTLYFFSVKLKIYNKIIKKDNSYNKNYSNQATATSLGLFTPRPKPLSYHIL